MTCPSTFLHSRQAETDPVVFWRPYKRRHDTARNPCVQDIGAGLTLEEQNQSIPRRTARPKDLWRGCAHHGGG